MFEKIRVANVDGGRCLLCSPCPAVDACEHGALFRLDEDEAPVVEQSLCQGCGDCERACPHGAIKLKAT